VDGPLTAHKLADKPADTKTIKAAGAVAWRPRAAGGDGGDGVDPEILLVHRAKYDDWSLPKGKVEPGEYFPVTAVREVLEEGGARLALGRRLRPVRYKVNGRAKVVAYWAARVTGLDDDAVPNGEVDDIAWLTVAQAREKVTYAHDIGVLDDFAAAPAATVPLIMLRHAKAMPRPAWPGDDASRPLDAAGRAEANVLASLLACFAPDAQVISSATVRCLETVRPYAALTGARVQPTAELLASAAGSGVREAQVVAARAVAAAAPAVLCAHRENLPALMAAAAARLGAASLPPLCADPLATGSFCVLHMAEGRLAGADRYEVFESLGVSWRGCAAGGAFAGSF
jgi:8-oxo-dGTP pyrophosphatase MutT (NUDIX family)/phosphohistidine phosphatase SixA